MKLLLPKLLEPDGATHLVFSKSVNPSASNNIVVSSLGLGHNSEFCPHVLRVKAQLQFVVSKTMPLVAV